jgi:predicted nucleotidyltransferase
MKQEFYSTSEARKNLSSLVSQVRYQKKEFAIGRHGHSEAYLVPHEIIDSLKATKSQEDLFSKFLKNSLEELAIKYKLNLIILFGSYAKGTVKAGSDIDIAVVPHTALSQTKEQNLYHDLVKIFSRADIDLVNLNTSHNVLLEYEIFSKGKVLYQSDREYFVNKRMKAYFDYQDFKTYLNQQKDAFLSALDNLKF